MFSNLIYFTDTIFKNNVSRKPQIKLYIIFKILYLIEEYTYFCFWAIQKNNFYI